MKRVLHCSEDEPIAVGRFDVEDVVLDDSAPCGSTPQGPIETHFVQIFATQGGQRADDIRIVDHLPGHERLLDFLIERAFSAWIRSQG